MKDVFCDGGDGQSITSESTPSRQLGKIELSRSSGAETSTEPAMYPSIPRDGQDFNIARAEDEAILRIRLAVFAFLTICAGCVSSFIYFSTRNREQEEFEASLEEFSSKVFGSIAAEFDQAWAAIDSHVVATVSYARASNSSFPFVTLPNSAIRLSKVRRVTRAVVVITAILVSSENLEEWNDYSLSNGPAWVEETLRVQKKDPSYSGSHLEHKDLSPIVNGWGESNDSTEYFPTWQTFPIASTMFYPFNLDFGLSGETLSPLRKARLQITGVVNHPNSTLPTNYFLAGFGGGDFNITEPVSVFHYPIFKSAAENVRFNQGKQGESEMVGVMWIPFYWRNKLLNILPQGVNGIILVVRSTCNAKSTSDDISASDITTFTYEINGPEVDFLGFGDHHGPKYDHLVSEAGILELNDYASGSRGYTGLPLSQDECVHTFSVYASQTFEDAYTSSDPWIYTAATTLIFIFTSLVFGIYDCLVERRQRKVMSTAVRSSAIVSSLFPSNVRARLYDNNEEKDTSGVPFSQKNRLKTFMSNSKEEGRQENSHGTKGFVGSRPIADLFPEATVMFADITGFTAWSSTREPSQVFILLEALYGKFDALAARRGIFKVETIGDCYVAVAGLPDPRADHAVVMAKYARDCCTQMATLMSKLTVTLGPDTENLSMRFGLNSGPVTAGVLRGQKSRFQLFGDTVNTASRMESTGESSRIQASQSTADELIKHKKSHWLRTRVDKVEIKGKGRMITYWVTPQETVESSSDGRDVHAIEELESSRIPIPNLPSTIRDNNLEDRIARLVDWNTDVLGRLIRDIVADRTSPVATESLPEEPQRRGLPIEEVKEIIELPSFAPKGGTDSTGSVQLDPLVTSQLHAYVEAIAATYHGSKNPFHNFEHASHVCMSVSKLMSRIVADDSFFDQEGEGSSMESFKHQRTFGIASDPLTLFACAFAALIHDVDHPGVPNTQLVKEGTTEARKYQNRSVAEQHSVDIAWELLMEDQFIDLRRAICPTAGDLQRLRQLVVNSVLATDIMDPELKRLRNERWDRAFNDKVVVQTDSSRDHVNRKATIVIEHLIQASDVAHTMQHWHVFRKWNERLFMEMFQAYESGRSEKNPAEFWYKGELVFFDKYIIPLAKKLSDCGVFGVSSDEYLNYAMKNREEWEMRGEQIVAEMVDNLTY